jgi:hypothetical protein
VHWHMTALPPAVPCAEQQLAALDVSMQPGSAVGSVERR